MHMHQDINRHQLWAYVIVALAGLLVGMALGQLNANRDAGRSRIDWPAPKVPQPRSLGP